MQPQALTAGSCRAGAWSPRRSRAVRGRPRGVRRSGSQGEVRPAPGHLFREPRSQAQNVRVCTDCHWDSEDWEDSVSIGRKREWFKVKMHRVLQCHCPCMPNICKLKLGGSQPMETCGPVPAGRAIPSTAVHRLLLSAYLTISSARSTSCCRVRSHWEEGGFFVSLADLWNHACKLSQLPGTVF